VPFPLLAGGLQPGQNLAGSLPHLEGPIGQQDKANNIGQLLNRYTLQVVQGTTDRAGSLLAISTLRNLFGNIPIGTLTPSMSTKWSFLGDREGQKESARFEAENISYNYLLKGALLKAIVKLSFRKKGK
jgi:hypothetical protein